MRWTGLDDRVATRSRGLYKLLADMAAEFPSSSPRQKPEEELVQLAAELQQDPDLVKKVKRMKLEMNRESSHRILAGMESGSKGSEALLRASPVIPIAALAGQFGDAADPAGQQFLQARNKQTQSPINRSAGRVIGVVPATAKYSSNWYR